MVHCHVSKISKISTPSPPKKVITKQKLKKSPSHFSQHLSMNRHEGHFCALQAQGQHQEGGTQTLWAQPEASRHAGFKKDMPSKQKNMLHMWVEVRHRSWWPFRGKTWRFFLEGKNPPKWSIGKKKRLPETTPNIFDRPTAGQTTRIVVVPHGQTRHIGWQLLVAQLLFGPWA